MTNSQINTILTKDTEENILYIKVRNSLHVYPDRNELVEFNDADDILHVIDNNGNHEYWSYGDITMIRFRGEKLTSYEEQLFKPDNKVIRS